MNLKSKYISSAFVLVISSVAVKLIGAVYKIPLTTYIGAVGRGYFATAYNFYLPVYALTMGALPVALSKLVSKYNAAGNERAVFALKKASTNLFFAVGFFATAIMMAFSPLYCNTLASSPKSVYTVLVLAPSVLFSCAAASFRGYYEGFMNMVPTSVSQGLEALSKMIFGLVFSKLSMAYLTEEYALTGEVLGKKAATSEEALSMIYPLTSACAMLGVTLGAVVSFAFVFAYHSINASSAVCPNGDVRSARREIISLSLPIMLSCAVQSIFQFCDTASVQYSLSQLETSSLRKACCEALSYCDVADGDMVTYAYGLLSSSLDFKNFIPGITMALGVCAVPAVSRAFELGSSEKMRSLINSIYKYTVLLSAAGGMELFLFSHEILDVFYGSSSPDIVAGCERLTAHFGATAFLYCLAGVAVYTVQALGKPQKSIAPYIVSGAVRILLNLVLVGNENFVLTGCVISGAVGYAIIFLWNTVTVLSLAGIRISFADIVLKPFAVCILAYFVWQEIKNFTNFGLLPIYNLLIKSAIFGTLFIILCFLCGLLKIGDVFCLINFQKIRQNT